MVIVLSHLGQCFYFLFLEVLEFQNSTSYFSTEEVSWARGKTSLEKLKEAQMKLKEFIFRCKCWGVLNNNE